MLPHFSYLQEALDLENIRLKRVYLRMAGINHDDGLDGNAGISFLCWGRYISPLYKYSACKLYFSYKTPTIEH